MYIVFFLIALSAATNDADPVCIALSMHIMKYDRLVFVKLHIHNEYYLAMHLHHMTMVHLVFWQKREIHISMSAGRTTTHWHKFRSVATAVSDVYDYM